MNIAENYLYCQFDVIRQTVIPMNNKKNIIQNTQSSMMAPRNTQFFGQIWKIIHIFYKILFKQHHRYLIYLKTSSINSGKENKPFKLIWKADFRGSLCCRTHCFCLPADPKVLQDVLPKSNQIWAFKRCLEILNSDWFKVHVLKHSIVSRDTNFTRCFCKNQSNLCFEK